MKKLIKLSAAALMISAIFSSCATIVGGKSYTAYVDIDGDDNAKVYYQGTKLNGSVEVPRKRANKLQFKVESRGCPSKDYNFTTRKFRGWAFVGSLFFPTISFIPIPNAVDFAVGGYWKPDHNDSRIRKLDYDTYQYTLPFDCKSSSNPEKISSKEKKLVELKELFDKGMITEEEYNESRQKVLAQ